MIASWFTFNWRGQTSGIHEFMASFPDKSLDETTSALTANDLNLSPRSYFNLIQIFSQIIIHSVTFVNACLFAYIEN